MLLLITLERYKVDVTLLESLKREVYGEEAKKGNEKKMRMNQMLKKKEEVPKNRNTLFFHNNLCMTVLLKVQHFTLICNRTLIERVTTILFIRLPNNFLKDN